MTQVPRTVQDIEDSVDNSGHLLNQHPAYNRLIHSEMAPQLGDQVQRARMVGRSVGLEGIVVGEYDDDPMLDSLWYNEELPDATTRGYSANIIAENMLTKVDSDGYSLALLEAIVKFPEGGNSGLTDDRLW